VSLNKAGYKAAVYLGQAGKGLTPDETKVYELPPITEIAKGKENLPKVVYIMNLYRYYLKEEFAIYGKVYPWTPSMLLHPNEVLDGVVVNPYLNTNGPAPATLDTYALQNHPVVEALYERHGKDLLFLGVIPTVAMLEDADVASHENIALKLALHLGADGAILTKATGGSPQMDIATFAIKASEYGIKSALVMDDMAARSSDSKFRVNGIIFSNPKAAAMVNTGNISITVQSPAVQKAIGHPVEGVVATGPYTQSLMTLLGQGAQLGNTKLVEFKY
jgi:glycine reductase